MLQFQLGSAFKLLPEPGSVKYFHRTSAGEAQTGSIHLPQHDDGVAGAAAGHKRLAFFERLRDVADVLAVAHEGQLHPFAAEILDGNLALAAQADVLGFVLRQRELLRVD